MPSRRDFLHSAAALAATAGIHESIQRALAIEPEVDSTVMDAEHVVILMQENRSFDHVYGSLQGVRGFNDPRSIKLPDGNPVWIQTAKTGEKHVPFRLDLQGTKATWMGSLPHSWTDQVDAANGGLHDRWLQVKYSGKGLPMTLGHYSREDLPFYYALADAFTICDQHFCSSLTGTTPNRLHLWTGKTKPLVHNSDCDYGSWQNWPTFPERLEDHGTSWKIYQNELETPTGLSKAAEGWVGNFGDNPIEWFTQFGVRFFEGHRKFVEGRVKALPGEIEALTRQVAKLTGEAAAKAKKTLAGLKATLAKFQDDSKEFSAENFAKLSPKQKSLHARAFVTNLGDPAHRDLMEISYQDAAATRKVKVPKGDVLHQFRRDVTEGTLPTVLWLVAPAYFSDHPSSAWYGAWYVSEVMDILTKNPAVWKKTVFILTYDENDGQFDHVPPFQAPRPGHPETGLTSGIDTTDEYLEAAEDRKLHKTGAVRGNSIGLGFRVPMVIASPWSRGGCVCSQVFDHTSVIQFVEKLVSHKTGRKLVEPNISQWRRTVCGDLTSSFQTAKDNQPGLKGFLPRDAFVEGIHKAQYLKAPPEVKPLTAAEIEIIRTKPAASRLPKQEPGTRKSCPLPYELYCDGAVNGKAFQITFEAKKDHFAERGAGAAFIAYAATAKGLAVRHFTVAAGGKVIDTWPLELVDRDLYDLRVHGPNGFYREFRGGASDPALSIACSPNRDGSVEIESPRAEGLNLTIVDGVYGHGAIAGAAGARMKLETSKSHGWYDFTVSIKGFPAFHRRYAGRVETGQWSISDPAMGRGG